MAPRRRRRPAASAGANASPTSTLTVAAEREKRLEPSRPSTPEGEGRKNHDARTPSTQRRVFHPTCTPSTTRRHDVVSTGDPERFPVEVFLRIRPMNDKEIENGVESIRSVSGEQVCIRSCDASSAATEGRYSFTRVLDTDVRQKETFRTTTLPLLHSFLNKFHSALLFAYGRTGGGKTYTMIGTDARSGVMPRTFDVIFNSIYRNSPGVDTPSKRRAAFQEMNVLLRMCPKRFGRASEHTLVEMDKSMRYMVFLSFMEVYNEQIFDLLPKDKKATRPSGPLPLKEDIRGRPLVRGTLEIDIANKMANRLNQIHVKSAEEARDLVMRACKMRTSSSTEYNANSSRSHSVLNIKLVRMPKNALQDELASNPSLIQHCNMYICDLAGSERATATSLNDKSLGEACKINSSMLVFGRCVEALRYNSSSNAQQQKRVVPFRESKLTRLFQEFLTGNGRAAMLCCVSPCSNVLEETTHALKFAAMAREVVTTARVDTGRRRRIQTPSRMKTDITRRHMAAGPATPDHQRQKQLLLREIDEMRTQLQEAEDRCADMERTIREEVSLEMAEQIEQMEEYYNVRLQREMSLVEEKYQRKLEILNRINQQFDESAFGTAAELSGEVVSSIKRKLFSPVAADSSFDELESDDDEDEEEDGGRKRRVCGKSAPPRVNHCSDEELRDYCVQLQTQLEEKDRELRETQIRLSSSEMEKEKIGEQISALEEAVRQFSSNTEARHIDLRELETTMAEKTFRLETECSELTQELERASRERDALKERVKQLQKTADALGQTREVQVNIDEKQQDRLRKTLKSPLSKAKTAAPSQHDEGNANTMRKRGRATAAKAKAKAKGTLTRRKGRNAAKGKENEVEETMREHEDVAYEHHQKSSVLVEEEEMDEEEAEGGVGPLMESEDSDGEGAGWEVICLAAATNGEGEDAEFMLNSSANVNGNAQKKGGHKRDKLLKRAQMEGLKDMAMPGDARKKRGMERHISTTSPLKSLKSSVIHHSRRTKRKAATAADLQFPEHAPDSRKKLRTDSIKAIEVNRFRPPDATVEEEGHLGHEGSEDSLDQMPMHVLRDINDHQMRTMDDDEPSFSPIRSSPTPSPRRLPTRNTRRSGRRVTEIRETTTTTTRRLRSTRAKG